MVLNFRLAKESDLPNLLGMLMDDSLGATREDGSLPINQRYVDMFHFLDQGNNNEIIVAENKSNAIGMLHMTYIPCLTHIGSWRCLIEGVRVAAEFRGHGVGKQFFQWAIERARERGCYIMQLTSNKKRTDAIRFYNMLGFSASHEGFKFDL
jgi:GNAT superfamily N-acetyltransferase